MAIAFIRTLILYLVIIFAMRIMGRRQVGELQPSELAITMLISNLAALPMEDRALPLITGLIPILALVCFEIFTSYMIKSSSFLRRQICGSPLVIIKDGQIDQKVLKKLRFSVEDLIEALRRKDVFDFSQVDCAVAETTGELSVFKKYPYQEVQNQDLFSQKEDAGAPYIVVAEGKISQSGLRLCEKNEKFIHQALIENACHLKDVLVMLCDRSGKYTLVKKES